MRRIVPLALLAALGACATLPAIAPPSSGTSSAAIGQSADFGQVRVAPIAIVEDSRCPQNARCIWAGRLIVDADVYARGTKTRARVPLGETVHNAAGDLSLVGATPPAMAGGAPLRPSDYRLTFEFQPS